MLNDTEFQKIFQENEKIHRKTIETVEKKQEEFWGEKLNKAKTNVEKANIVYMAISGCGEKIGKIILRKFIQNLKTEEKNNETINLHNNG